MSLDNEDQRVLDQPAEANHETRKKSKIMYTRDFLLSLSELDICKKLPSGFDQSLLSEFEDAPQDRSKISGSLSLHSYRRNEYGSSPPTRGESGNYSRGIHGRWDSRPSGRSDRDGDSQSDWDSDSGKRYGNQTRRSWHVPEHDGLLGSGSFARPSGYATGASAPKSRTNDHYQLNRSSEPYHPPRPYKAVPHSRKETNDSYNDETFGSSECTSEDRAEEERKRRVSFELMRKEQQKTFQEKQRSNFDKRKDEFDITTLMEDSKDDEGISSRSKQFGEPLMLPVISQDSDKTILPSQTPASRPLVPPGFANAGSERNMGTKAITNMGVGNTEPEGGFLHAKGSHHLNGIFNNQEESAEQVDLSQQLESVNVHVQESNRTNIVQNLTSDLEVSNELIGQDSQSHKNSDILKAFEASDKSEGVELDAEKVRGGNKILGGSSQDQSSSILDKLFGSVLTVNIGGSNSLIEQHDYKADDTSPRAVQSSKFARWFLEEEKKPVDDLSSGRPNNLLSLIVSGEKVAPQASDVKAPGHISFAFASQSPELADGLLTSNVTSVSIENYEQSSDVNISKPAAVPAVLTCEDLEQSILSEISGNDDNLQPPVQGGSSVDAKTEQTIANADDHASHHLLSLLHKGTGFKDAAHSSGVDIILSDKPRNVEVSTIHPVIHDSKLATADNVTNTGKSLTLEALFGTAFMKELQSAGAPSSAQKSSIRSAKSDASELHDSFVSSNLDIGPAKTSYESSVLISNQTERTRSDRIKEHLLGLDGYRTDIDSSQLQSDLEPKLSGFDRSVDVGLPEEDSLVALGDPMKHLRNSSKAELFPSPAAPVDVTEKLAALNSTFGDERSITGGQEGLPFLHGPYDARERNPSFHNLNLQPSSQLHHPQLSHSGPPFNPLDSHPANLKSAMKFMGPESIIHHDHPPAHQFPASMPRPPFHHPNAGLAGFDHHHMLQQMHMPGSFPPPHLLRGFPSAPHSNNQIAGFVQHINPTQGFPSVHRQPNFNGLGMPPPVPEVEGGNNKPETLQRLFEMELRSNAKQIHPLAAGGRNPGMYELDTGFGYR